MKDPRDLTILERGKRTPEKQEQHTMEAAKLLEHDLKTALLALTMDLFGSGTIVAFLGNFVDLRTLTNCDTKNDSDTSPGLMYG